MNKLYIMICVMSMVLGLVACKGNQQSASAESVAGKQVKAIQHYTIQFEDGTTYDMDEKGTNKIFYLIRHAEKDTSVASDPPLNKEGEQRSFKLAQILKNTNLDAIFSTMTTRTLFTVDSLADIKDMVTLPYEAKDFKELAKALQESLNYHRALVVGHSNTIPVMANYLLDAQIYNKTFDENEYDNLLIILEKNDSTKTLLQLKY